MRCASAVCERPENTISFFCGPRSSQWPVAGCVTASGDSRPGRTSSVAALPGCIPLLVLLARPGDAESVWWHILGYDRPCSDPCSVSYLDGRDETIVDRGPDVAADRRPCLRRCRSLRCTTGAEPCSGRRAANS